MITQIDAALKLYLRKSLGDLGDTILDFSAKLPDRAWLKDATSSESWINIYLMEVKENLELRRNEWQRSYEGDEVTSKKPPHYVDLYYLITFYNKHKKSEIEHAYLENTLLALFDFANLAPAYIADKALLKAMTLELFPKPYIDDQLGFQFWNALDQDARPYIPMKITVPLSSTVADSGKIVKEKHIAYETLDEVLCTLSGKVLFSTESNGQVTSIPVSFAEIEIMKKGGKTIQTLYTDAVGNFRVTQLKNEAVTILVKAEGYLDRAIDLDDIPNTRTMTIEMKK